ncbi:flagellar motor switch protein FliG [Glaciimonas sp. Gout2]|uniref:flagellar motor switch protein FliG n=2 Tax=Glaciimonas TaxID=1229970 RepID=UPI002AB35A64|nr:MULTISPECIES: flagellar motor switch protein FliG [unclassified Glaciimonas]MDY7548037.1 flagellar motor switch protein FliG [Glaciimonas sp. CA11.2]MEB0010207.1 flagellar motor switch protein FliG [Glaciimonas sp. Cout2]MEB0083706.1 flagellar motor switch protein FliG [Glaciimonas sp. Gout2]
MDNEGIKKSAILLLSLGEDGAANVFKHMTPQAVQALCVVMSQLRNVKRDHISTVLDEFRVETEQFSAISLDSSSYIRAVLNKAVGGDRASDLMEDILNSADHTRGIESLNWLEATEVAELIRDEHPQIIATMMVHLERSKASKVLELLDERLRHDVVLRIATFGGVQPAALNELTEVLSGLLSGHGTKRSRLGGVRAAAEMLNLMSSAQEESVIQHVRNYDDDLAQRIVDEMFLFENLLEIDDRGIQMLLKEIESETLIIALKGAPQELRDKFLNNMSQRAAEMLRDDLELRGPVRVSQVETHQKVILQIVRRLADSGEIIMGGQGDDAFV